MVATKSRLLAAALLLALTAFSVSSAAPTSDRQPSRHNAARQAALTAYRALPLAFVENAGQLDRRVRYSAQAGGASVFLTRRSAVVALGKGRHGFALRLSFLGANGSPTMTGARRSPGTVNYLVGNDPSRWQRNLPTYEEVVYRDLWPGIDLAVRGDGGQLKYEFRLAPGADPARIRLAYRGQERLSLGRGGALRVETALGLLRDARPVSYQTIGGRRLAVAGRFALGEGGAYGFALDTYDRRHPLVIDPGLLYSTYLGGSLQDDGRGIAVDRAGGAYVTGTTGSTNFPTAAGAFDTSHNGGDYDVFVAKLNAAGSALAYSTYLGGDSWDGGRGIAVDRVGSAYVTGSTGSSDFPTTAAGFDRTFNGRDDVFVTKLNVAGSALAYSTYLGGRSVSDLGGDGSTGIAVDGAGSAYVTGHTRSGDFPTTAGAFDRSYGGGGHSSNAFVTKLNAAGSTLVYSTYLGGSGDFSGDGIAVDAAARAYVTGYTTTLGFPTTRDAFDRTLIEGVGDQDAFVTKLNAAGSALAYSTYLGASSGDSGSAIAVDGAGSAYVTGWTESTNFPTTAGAFDRSYNGDLNGDGFVTKLALVAGPAPSSGSSLEYWKVLGALLVAATLVAVAYLRGIRRRLVVGRR